MQRVTVLLFVSIVLCQYVAVSRAHGGFIPLLLNTGPDVLLGVPAKMFKSWMMSVNFIVTNYHILFHCNFNFTN